MAGECLSSGGGKTSVGVDGGHGWPALPPESENECYTAQFCAQMKHLTGVCKSSEIQDNFIFLTKLTTWRTKEHFLWAFVLGLTFIYLISFLSHDNPVRPVFLSSVYR